MSDITERLRAIEYLPPSQMDAVLDAADEIDRLRAELAEAKAQPSVSDYWLDGKVIRKGKEYVAEIIGQEPLLLRELLTGKHVHSEAQRVPDGLLELCRRIVSRRNTEGGYLVLTVDIEALETMLAAAKEGKV